MNATGACSFPFPFQRTFYTLSSKTGFRLKVTLVTDQLCCGLQGDLEAHMHAATSAAAEVQASYDGLKEELAAAQVGRAFALRV